MHKKLGRNKPYLESEINKLPCFRCGKPSSFQWNICADGKYHPVCLDCDIKLNELVLNFMEFPNKNKLLENYIKSKKAIVNKLMKMFPSSCPFIEYFNCGKMGNDK